MVDQTSTVHRPSPRPRPADSPHLRVVPDDIVQSETATAENMPLQDVPAGQDLAGDAESPRIAGSAARIRGFWNASKAYWTAPSVFTDRPASLEELAAYANRAPWTHQQTGPIRAAGIGWYRFVGYPYTVVSRYREWLVQRPLRFAALAGGIKLFSLTGPGDWVVHTVIYPAVQLAGHVFL